MAKPLVSVDTILETALNLLDEEGPEALSARNLAAVLKCSTRTLYQQVGKREALIGKLVTHHLDSLALEFHPGDTWQDSARLWAHTIRGALLAHPNLARLMTTEHRGPVVGYVNELLKILLKAGFNEELALRSCRVLANVAISLTLSELTAPAMAVRHARRSDEEVKFEELVVARSGADPEHFQEPPEVFDNAVAWLIAGLEREHSAG
ncbi:MAG: TetR family transcriptional regulator [Halioglobus sp.]|nr:TetR family transcriptional regulator [Halioglobus sp.]